jgi:hypothetical protein
MDRDDALAAHGALFRVEGEELVPTDLARGPWDPDALHGGPTAALLARAIERHDPGPASFVTRLTVELFRPVPLAPLRLAARTTRPGRNVQSLVASVFAAEVEVARATALRIRTAPLPMEASSEPSTAPPPARGSGSPPPFANIGVVGYWSACDLDMVEGSWLEPGSGTAWIRLRCPVIEGEEPTPLQRVAAAADFGSGVGNPVRMSDIGAINPDLTIHVHRDAVGEWIALRSRAWAHATGVGMAETALFDEHGHLGVALQSLLVQEHRRPIGSS